MQKILVCGGRDYVDRPRLFAVLDWFDEQHGIDVVVHGDARGADRLSGDWAVYRGKPIEKYPADWQRDGKAAGCRRNQQMLDEARPAAVIVFPGGRGTADMRRRAEAAGLPIVDVS